VLRLPDGGIVGGPCMPNRCSEIACGDGIDNDNNGSTDCADPACNYLYCNDNNSCTAGERCGPVGTCANPQLVLTCNMPPAGGCFRTTGECRPGGCVYTIAVGQACGIAGSVCMSDGSCGPNLGLGNFTYTPSNFNPNSVQFYGDRASTNGSATFDTTTSTFGGAWAVRPIVNQVMTPTGPAVVLAAEGFDIVGNLRVLGDKPIIFASTDTFELRGVIDVSAYQQTPGPGGHVNCGSSVGGSGSLGSNSASGGGGAGGAEGPGGNGGGGSTFGGGAGGNAGAQRSGGNGVLLGGCPGGSGGNGGGVGGAGGGAIQISSSVAIGIYTNSAIFAVGTAGKGGTANGSGGRGTNGGGGGGSGGTILLETPYIFAENSSLLATGGGGGEGSGWLSAGRDGFDGNWYNGYGAPGGAGLSGNGGNGGAGGAVWNTAQAGRPGTQWNDNDISFYESGGGGGGGAAGRVRVTMVAGGLCVIPHEHVAQSPRLSNNDQSNCYY
jgi:hypothetical protein